MKRLSHLALWKPLTLAGHKNNILCSKWNHLWVNQCGWQSCSKCLIGPEAKPRLVWQEVVRLSVTCHPKKCLFSVTRPSRRRLPSPATLAGGNNLLLPSDHHREVCLFRSSDGAHVIHLSVWSVHTKPKSGGWLWAEPTRNRPGRPESPHWRHVVLLHCAPLLI